MILRSCELPSDSRIAAACLVVPSAAAAQAAAAQQTEQLNKQLRLFADRFRLDAAALLTVGDCLRCGFTHFKLSADFLETRSERCNLFLQLLHRAVLFHERPVLFEKLV